MSNDKRENQVNERDENQSGKDPNRVEGGRKAAETRGHESLSEAGRKGGEHSHGGQGSQGKQENK